MKNDYDTRYENFIPTHTHTDTRVFLPVWAQNFVECTNSPSILYRSGTDYKREIVYNTITLSKYNENTKHTHRQTNKQIINCQRTSAAEGYNKKLSSIYASVHTLFPAMLFLSFTFALHSFCRDIWQLTGLADLVTRFRNRLDPACCQRRHR